MRRRTPIAPRPKWDKDASELLLERYLDAHGISWRFEAGIEGRKKKPDYELIGHDPRLFCEVKGLHERRPRPLGCVAYDPYGGIRKEIHESRRQFREYKDCCCVLVLHNVDDWEFRDRSYIVFGAMLGNLGIVAPFDGDAGIVRLEQRRSAFLDGGKMVDAKHHRPQNSTISAIAVLSEITLPNPAFEAEFHRRLAELRSERPKRKLVTADTVDVRMRLYEDLSPTLGARPRISIFENPIGRPAMQLPQSVFSGEYDSRYVLVSGKVERVFAGRGLLELESWPSTKGDSLLGIKAGPKSAGAVLQKLDLFRADLIRKFDPLQITLFGSYAYGCPEPDSDVDLLVVFPGDDDADHRSLDIRSKLIADFPLDLLTRSAGQIERRRAMGDPFIEEIVNRGKVLYPRNGET